MDTRLLRIFVAVAESGSLVAAADKVHLTPSAVSHTLKSLETQLACRLFERVGKKMALNHAGEQLLAQVQGPLAALEAAAAGIKRLGKWGQSRLRIGASQSACEHILPKVIRELRKLHPTIELHIECGDTPQVLEQLHANKVDLGIGLTPINPVGLATRPIFRDELMFVFAPSHPWADGRPITPDDIRKQPFILYPHSSLTGYLLDDYFHKLQIVPNTAIEMANISGIIELVKMNQGVSVLAPWTVNSELVHGSLKMRPLGTKTLHRKWALISLASRRMTLAEETFCKLCRSTTAGMRLDRNDLPLPLNRAPRGVVENARVATT
jgi:DNA-binding transcriptional LysR family regulator